MPTLTPTQARHLQLAAQGLLAPPRRTATPMALRQCIGRMQLLQIDTISVVARSPYFVLPILHNGALVGRLDAKAHRAQGVFEVKSLFVEEGVRLSDAAVRVVAEAIQRCADWHGTPELRVGRVVPAELLEQLREAWD